MLDEAERGGVWGARVTPFLLARVAELTSGGPQRGGGGASVPIPPRIREQLWRVPLALFKLFQPEKSSQVKNRQLYYQNIA